MTTFAIVNQAEDEFLDLILAPAMNLRLFSNDVISGLTNAEIDALTEADFTEANFAGYAATSLTAGNWVVTQGDPTEANYNADQTFTRSSTGTAQNIYGYYVTLTTGGALRWFEQFDAPIVVEFINDAVTITPQLTLDDTDGGNDVPTGGIIPWAGAAAPPNFLLCDGAAVSRTTYARLFAEIGTTYGVGDGSTTFNVPDMRQRFPLGVAASGTGATLGGTGGAIDHVHGHNGTDAAALIALQTSNERIEGKIVSGITSYTADRDFTATGANVSAISGSRSEGSELAGDTETENPPFLALNFVIKF